MAAPICCAIAPPIRRAWCTASNRPGSRCSTGRPSATAPRSSSATAPHPPPAPPNPARPRPPAAHSPLSAMLVAEAGSAAIWASGFELSAMYGVPDVSVVSMTQHLDMPRAMVERSGIPVVADIDTGFGNAINVLYAVDQYERAGAAAIVMEDKSFPKVTSLIADGRQDMVRIEEFQGKIEAARTARKDKDFVIVARTEALIAGLGQDEA